MAGLNLRWCTLGGALLVLAILAGVRLQLPASAWFGVLVTTTAVGWLGERMIPGRFSGIAAAGVFASMPLITQNAAALPVALMLVVLTWLAAIECYQRTRARSWLSVAALALGAGMGLGGDAPILLPSLAAGTAVVLLLIDEPSALHWRALMLPAMFGLVAVAPFAIYLVMHPEWLAMRVAAYHLYDAGRFNPLQGAREVASWVGLTARSEVYWHYFDPVFLFLSASVFWLPAAILLPVGVARAATEARRLPALALLGLCAAPLPAAVLLQGPAAARFVPAAPFAAVLMAAALGYLWTAKPAWQRVTGMTLAIALAVNALLFALTRPQSVP